jgi:hypothetical protein
MTKHALKKRFEGAAMTRSLRAKVRIDEDHDRTTAQRRSDSICHHRGFPRDRQLGHADPALTLRVYAHLMPSEERDLTLRRALRSATKRHLAAPALVRAIRRTT